ncbi:hypothetical protein ACFSTC_21110 [Nonomuraea ferruginea]
MRRSRRLTGLREIGKFAWLPAIQAARRQLLLVGADLAARDRLADAERHHVPDSRRGARRRARRNRPARAGREAARGARAGAAAAHRSRRPAVRRDRRGGARPPRGRSRTAC